MKEIIPSCSRIIQDLFTYWGSLGGEKKHYFNPIALRKAKILYNFGPSECSRVKMVAFGYNSGLPECECNTTVEEILYFDLYLQWKNEIEIQSS